MSIRPREPVLVTGGAGFIGCNVADALAARGHEVLVYDALSRRGVERNLAWLAERHPDRIRSIVADVRDRDRLTQVVKNVGAVFHFAAQVAVTTSLENPREDFEINVGGTFNLLDAVRGSGRRMPVIFASTNKVYGDLADIPLALVNDGYQPCEAQIRDHGVDEGRPLNFHTPYGCSKGAADQYVLDHARSFGIPAVVFRMSCIYGQRQMGSEDQGWVAHFLIRALEDNPITLYGDGHQVRDILSVQDAAAAYLSALDRIEQVAGMVFNLGGGPDNAVSLRQLIDQIETILERQVRVRWSDWRAGDQRYFVADTRLAELHLAHQSRQGWKDGIAALAQWLAAERDIPFPFPAPLALAFR